MQEEKDDINSTVQFRNKLIAILSHETKGLLANVFWLIEAIENGMEKDSIKDLVPELKAVADKNLDELNDVLLWIKSQGDSFQMNKTFINIYDFFSEVKHFFAKQLLQKNQELILIADKNVHFFSNYMLLKLVVKNIIKYALKFSESGININLNFVAKEATNETMIIFQNIDGDGYTEDFNINFAKEIASLIKGKISMDAHKNISLILPLQ